MFNNPNEIEALISRLIDKLDSSETDSLELEIADVKIKLGKHKRPPHHEMPHHEMPPHGMPHGMPPHGMPPIPAQYPASVPSVPMNAPAQAPAPSVPDVSAVQPDVPAKTVNAPLLGVAYAASSPDAAPFVKVGDKVKKGDVICIIEAMKVMNEIESDKDGEVAEILFENGKMVEYGQPLISVK